MFADRIEGKWIDTFERVLGACGVNGDSLVGIIAETQSRALNVHLCELALHRLGARQFKLVAQSTGPRGLVPLRSAGTSGALTGLEPIIGALAPCQLVLDLTVEGILHAPQLQAIAAAGPRFLFVSNEHPEVLERLVPDATVDTVTRRGAARLAAAKVMRVTSRAGTDVTIALSVQHPMGISGVVAAPGELGHWPGGLVATFPGRDAVNGTIVVDAGDINCTFKRYLERPMQLHIERDMIVAVEGDGVDAALFRSYSESWGDPNALACAHFGWGTNPKARWDSLALYDRRDTNAIEARCFAGNFLVGIGASHVAERFTENHFDLPMRNATVELDGVAVVRNGALVERAQ